MRLPRHRLLLASLLLLWGACRPFNSSLLRHQGGPATDGGNPDAAATDGAPQDGRAPEAGRDGCVPSPEICNKLDDDCDGRIDEDAQAACSAVILNAQSNCVPFRDSASCVLIQCNPGFDNCDGNPANGCEPFCACHACPDQDAGGDDAGSSPDAG